MATSSISKWFTMSITIKRMTAIDSKHETYQTIATAVPCLIQEFEPSRRITVHTIFKPFRMYCALTTNIAEEDIVIDNNNFSYTVKGVVRREQGLNPHYEVALDRAETQVDA